MPRFDPEAIKEVYERYYDPAAKERLVESCRQRVVRWRWATGLMAPDVSFHQELHKATDVPRWLDEGSKPEEHATMHGLDAEGIIHVARWPWSYSGIRGEYEYSDALALETYWIYACSETTLVTFVGAEDPAQRTPEVILQYRVDGGRLVWCRTFNSRDANEVQYQWRDNRLVREVHCCSSHPRYVPGEDPWAGTKEPWFLERTYKYGADGALEEVWDQYLEEDDQPCADLERTLRYRRPRKGETIPALSKAIPAMLLEQIPATVRAARIASPVYCLLICYCGEDFAASWPPFLVLGAEAERQRIIKEGRDVKYFLWAPDELRNREANHELGLNHQELLDKCRLHAQLMSMENRWDAGRRILRSVAQRLNEYRWSDIVATTDDFIVAAVDNTGERPVLPDIKAAVPPERLAVLKAKGLV